MSGGDPIAARERLICGPMEAYSRDRGSLFRSILERVKTLIALADRLVRAGDEHRANALLDEAQVVARTTDDDWKRGHALTAIASALVRVDRYDEALQFGHAVQGELSWSWALVDLTKALLQAGRYDKAKEGAHAIEGGVKRVKALGAVAYSLAQAGHYDEALETTDEVLEAINAIEDGAGTDGGGPGFGSRASVEDRSDWFGSSGALRRCAGGCTRSQSISRAGRCAHGSGARTYSGRTN